MTVELEVIAQLGGFWTKSGSIPPECSAVRVCVRLCGDSCEGGMLTVNGKGFEVTCGAAEICTEALAAQGRSCVSFTDAAGVCYPCADIIAASDGWRLPPITESVTEAGILELVAQNNAMRRRLEELASVAAMPISQVLGI